MTLWYLEEIEELRAEIDYIKKSLSDNQIVPIDRNRLRPSFNLQTKKDIHDAERVIKMVRKSFPW